MLNQKDGSKKKTLLFKKNILMIYIKCRPNIVEYQVQDQFRTSYIHSKTKLYNIYTVRNVTNSRRNLSQCLFDIDKKLSISLTKKYQCSGCYSHNVKKINESEFCEHIKKDRARQEKVHDKLKADSNKEHIFINDLQLVQLCLKLEISAIYYKTQLCV